MPGGMLRMVSVKETGRKMLEVAKKLDLPDFFLPNAEGAIENGTIYHLKCWVTIQCKQGTLYFMQRSGTSRFSNSPSRHRNRQCG